MATRIRLSESAVAGLEIYVTDIAHVDAHAEEFDADECAVSRAIAAAVSGHTLVVPDGVDGEVWWRRLCDASNGADADGDGMIARALATVGGKLLRMGA